MGKKNKGIPDRWLDYMPVGLAITGTNIVAFKVPLKTYLCQQHLPENEWFTPAMLLERQPKIKTVIDLTNTFRYYDGEEEFGTKGIDHVKILVEGRGTLPAVSQLQKFFHAVDQHMEKYKDNTDALIGVHCTHGLNRTGYFVCRWMIERLQIRPSDAIERFNSARGHKIERQNLLNDLRRSNLPSIPRSLDVTSLPPPRRPDEYRSPLEDYTDEEPSRSNSRYGRYRSRESFSDSSSRRRDEIVGDRDRDNRYSGYRNYNNRSDREGSNVYQKNNYNKNYNDTSRRRSFGGGKPSRSDLDTNWRARDVNESGAGLDTHWRTRDVNEIGGEERDRTSRNSRAGDSRKSDSRNRSRRN